MPILYSYPLIDSVERSDFLPITAKNDQDELYTANVKWDTLYRDVLAGAGVQPNPGSENVIVKFADIGFADSAMVDNGTKFIVTNRDFQINTDDLYVDNTGGSVGIGNAFGGGTHKFRVVDSFDPVLFLGYKDQSSGQRGYFLLGDISESASTHFVKGENGLIQVKSSNTGVKLDYQNTTRIGFSGLTTPVVISGSLQSGSTHTITSSSTQIFVSGLENTISLREGETNVVAPTVTGQENTVSGSRSFAGGYQNTASELDTFAFGSGNTSSGLRSLSIGLNNTSSGRNAISLGENNTATNERSVAIGSSNTSSGVNSFAANGGNTASGQNSSAFGTNNDAEANNSVCFGNGNTASGANSIAAGSGSTATTFASFAFGTGVNKTSTGIACGQYNADDDGERFSVGTGESDTERETAFAVKANGHIIMSVLQQSASYADDAAAAAGSVPIGGLYRNGSVVQIRIT